MVKIVSPVTLPPKVSYVTRYTIGVYTALTVISLVTFSKLSVFQQAAYPSFALGVGTSVKFLPCPTVFVVVVAQSTNVTLYVFSAIVSVALMSSIGK